RKAFLFFRVVQKLTTLVCHGKILNPRELKRPRVFKLFVAFTGISRVVIQGKLFDRNVSCKIYFSQIYPESIGCKRRFEKIYQMFMVCYRSPARGGDVGFVFGAYSQGDRTVPDNAERARYGLA